MLLKDLQQNVAGLKGLGVRACEKLLRLQIQHISDLLQHYPVRYLNHLEPLSLKAASGKLGEAGNQERHFYIRAQVVEHSFIPWRGGKHGRILKVGLAEADHIEEGSGNVSETAVFGSVRASLLCFGREFLAARMPIGSLILVAGTFQWRYGEFQSSNFVFEVPSDSVPKKPLAKESGAYNGSEFDCLLPVYSLTQGITQKLLRSTIAQALQHFSFAIEDELPLCLQKKYGLLGKKEALRELHFPASFERLALAHQSLVYEELLVLMLLIQRRRLQQHRSLQERHSGSSRFSLGDFGTLMAQARELLPFRLSEGQGRALAEILQCFTLDTPMNRLLQGDVGSGKTIVALLSCLPWLEAGAQVVLMAPTEILAQQLQNNFEMLRQKLEGAEEGNFLSAQAKITGGLGESAFLSGSVSPTQRKEILRSLREGKIRLLVGTHALFSSAVKFKNLRYIIVDEQHRFGVAQRLALKNKAPEAPHVLLMSATPIPRTLALTLYGDLEISSIDTMPQERKVIQTHLVRKGNDSKLYEFIRGELAASRQAYFICPLIDEDEELRSVEQMQAELESVFPQYPLAVVHGRMSPEQKYAAMDAFRAGKVRILLATTVVEVGIDVASASVIAIEHAERFGLAQLHQLRGRVGRGLDQGYCFLVYENEGLSSLAKERLMTLKNCHDGFAIAEKDLELRGPGDLLGKDQSGCMELRIAEIPADLECLEYARRDAVELLERDFGLLQAENQGLRQALLGKDSLDA